MERISFKTKAKDGVIKIPEKYKELSNSKLRVIISQDSTQDTVLKKIKITNPYQNVKDPKRITTLNKISEWQKKVRDEWK